MNTNLTSKSIVLVIIGSLILTAPGCNSSDTTVDLGHIAESALTGAALGWIVGHQSNEDCEGIAVGASVFGLLALLDEIEEVEEAKKETTVWVPNPDGSYTPVTIRQKKDFYVGPQGEYYKKIPAPEQLQTRYGLKKDKK